MHFKSKNKPRHVIAALGFFFSAPCMNNNGSPVKACLFLWEKEVIEDDMVEKFVKALNVAPELIKELEKEKSALLESLLKDKK